MRRLHACDFTHITSYIQTCPINKNLKKEGPDVNDAFLLATWEAESGGLEIQGQD